jgi:hypothetical protein
MQVERGKTRPNTMMTGHTGYITHARKIIKSTISQIHQKIETRTEEEIPKEEVMLEQENIDKLAETETA